MAQFDDPETRRANLRFIRAAMAMPMLTRARERELARRWREARDEAALHALTRAHARLVIAIAVRYRHYGLAFGDLVQEGGVGLMQAAERFEHTREVRFSTYATWWIRSAIQDYVLRNWSIVRTGTTAAQKALFFSFRRLRARIEQAGIPLDDAGRQHIADTLAVPLADVVTMERRLSGSDRSLNAPIGEEADEWQDLLPDTRPSPESVVIGMRDAETRSRWLAEALGALSPRERTIIHRRRLAEDGSGATLEELGRQLGVSKERVRQIETRALTKLRTSMMRHVEAAEDLIAPP